MKSAAVGFVVLLAAFRGVYGQQTPMPGKSAPEAPPAVAPEKLNDEQLRQALKASHSGGNEKGKRDRLFSEAVRRGGERWEEELRAWISAEDDRGELLDRLLPPSEKKERPFEAAEARRPASFPRRRAASRP